MATIIGDGTVGKALAKAMNITALGKEDTPVEDDVVIICVPTNSVQGRQDLSAVHHAMQLIQKAQLVIIRSTILPGTTDALQEQYSVPIMFVPEFGFEKTMYEDLKHPPYYLIGTTDKSFNARGLAKEVLPEADEYETMPAKAAEYAKYITNIWGCWQVTLANTVYDWMGSDAVLYTQALHGALRHNNLPKWGWTITDQGKRGYSGKCLPKDIKAAISQYQQPIWQAIDAYNDRLLSIQNVQAPNVL